MELKRKTSRIEHIAMSVPLMRFEVLQAFKKYPHVGPKITPCFLYASRLGETALLGEKQKDAENYSLHDVVDLMQCGRNEASGTHFRTFGKKYHFSAGELNQLLARSIIRIYII